MRCVFNGYAATFKYIMNISFFMTEIDVIARKWGDSLAIILPRDVVKKESIHLNDRIRVSVKKGVDISRIFGCWKTKKTAQELKDESRSGWE